MAATIKHLVLIIFYTRTHVGSISYYTSIYVHDGSHNQTLSSHHFLHAYTRWIDQLLYKYIRTRWQPQSNTYTEEPAVFVATRFIARYGKQLFVKYSRYADPMERTSFHSHPWRAFTKMNAMLQPHRGLVTSVLADFGTKNSIVFLIQSTLLFAADSLLHFLIGLCYSHVSYGRRKRPSRIRQSIFLLKEAHLT